MLKKAVRIIGNIILVFIFLLSLSILYSTYQSKNNLDQLPSIWGYKMLTVLTGSMEPELEPGDMVVVKEIPFEKLAIDNVVTYRNKENVLVTHRIIDLVNHRGIDFLQTKGDANNIEDEDLVSQEQIIGSVQLAIPKLGYLTNLLKSPIGLIIVGGIFLVFITIGISQKILLAKIKESE